MSGTIDAHHHLWHPARGDYDWMPMDNAVLARAYAPQDLAPQLAKAGVARTIIVQAAATVQETEYMLGLADATPWIAGVVGWFDFEKPQDAAHLKRLAQHPKFVGVRPMIQDIPDDNWMLKPEVQWAYSAIIEAGLCFDALGFPRHLGQFHTLLSRYPSLRVVLDHCMKPQIRTHSFESFATWAEGMRRLAEDTQAYCKLSGIVTESDGWRLEALRPYAQHVLDVFGAERVMWGSDWPVCRLEAEYGDWHDAAQTLTEGLDDAARARIFGGTAAEFYRV